MTDAREYVNLRLPELLQLLQESDVRELEVQEGTLRVRLHRAESLSEAAVMEDRAEVEPEPAVGPMTIPVISPLVGTFYRAGKPGMAPLVEEGSVVDIDTIVGIVEALQVLTEVEAGCRGTVTRALATDGQAVEYGQILFEVRSVG